MIVHMIGNAHIDPVWLWTWQAGVDEVLATFRSAVDRCREYPEFIFTRGEAWAYRIVERLDPPLFAEVRRLVRDGRWHVTGGQWIQPDLNLPTYEGLRRQFTRGRQYFADRFGITPDVGFNVDSFGHPATLPDLLCSEGLRGYVFHRPNQAQTALPAATFRWRGTKGAEVLAFRIPSSYTTRSDELYGQIMLSLDAADARIGHVMCFYGVGNHGGGPTKANIEYILEHRRAFGGAELQFSTPQRFFDCVHQFRDAMPVVDCELQRTFPGCYVVMQRIKERQRKTEHLLDQTRATIDAWGAEHERTTLHASLENAWDDLLFTQFHDILAGTSIANAWPSVSAMQGRAQIVGEELTVSVTRKWSRERLSPTNDQQIAVFQPGPEAFDGFIEHDPFLDFDAIDGRWLADQEGNRVPMQHVQARSTIMLTNGILFPARLGPGEVKTFTLRETSSPAAGLTNDMTANERCLTSKELEVQLGPTGIEAVRTAAGDTLGTAGLSLQLREDRDDTWGFKIDRFSGPVTATLDGCHWQVEESGPLRARARAHATIGRSPVELTVSIWHDRPTVELQIRVNFAEQFRLLQLPIAVRVAPGTWRCGIPGGAVTRESSAIEWPVQGWCAVDTLAVLGQDANSASYNDERLTWSLLRATRMAWSGTEGSLYAGRDDFTDQGLHTFCFHLMPVATDQMLDAYAAGLARPPIVFDRYVGMNRPPWGNNPPRRLWTDNEYRARHDGRMTHLIDVGGGIEG